MSRTSNGIRNSKVAVAYYILDILASLVSRYVFVRYLGAEVLGLNTTATNLLQFLNLAELGISQAVAFSLYKPLADVDISELREIVALHGWLYRRVALIVAGGAALLMCFFPFVFSKMELPLWYAYASFGVLLYGSLLTYWVSYKQIVLMASQQGYKVEIGYKSFTVLRTLAAIVVIACLPDGYVWWIVVYALFSTLGAFNIARVADHAFPYLKDVRPCVDKRVRVVRRGIMRKVKQLFLHKTAVFVFSHITPLVVYMYASLTEVACYGNYMIIVAGLWLMVCSVFNGIDAGVGDLIARREPARVVKVYFEVFSSRFLLVAACCFCYIFLVSPFISLWMGPEYLLSRFTVWGIAGTMFFQLFRKANDSFLEGFGLFGDIWSPVAEICLSIGLSSLLGYRYGIEGIVAGVFVTQLLICGFWKPYYLFSRGLKVSYSRYLLYMALHLAAFAAVGVFMTWLMGEWLVAPAGTFMQWGIKAVVSFLVTLMAMWFVEWIFFLPARAFTRRVVDSVMVRRLAA